MAGDSDQAAGQYCLLAGHGTVAGHDPAAVAAAAEAASKLAARLTARSTANTRSTAT